MKASLSNRSDDNTQITSLQLHKIEETDELVQDNVGTGAVDETNKSNIDQMDGLRSQLQLMELDFVAKLNQVTQQLAQIKNA